MAETEKTSATSNSTNEIQEMKKVSNPWKVSTIIFLLLSIVLIIMLFRGGVTGNIISSEDAGKQIVDALNSRVGGGITLASIAEEGDFYKATVNYQGSQIPVYVTKDGKYYTVQLTPLTGQAVQAQAQQQEQPAANVPKLDKPKAEAFVFSYCPYGLQFEKAILPVYKILKDKADFEIVAIGAMHGDYEKVESLRQICVQKEYGKDKLWEYLEAFMRNTAIGDCNNNQQCSLPLIEAIMAKIGIDKTKIENCVKSDAEKIYNEQGSRANSLGIGGSPTFVLNGAEVSVSRSPDAVMKAVCSAFNTQPAECSQTLATEQASPWFGYTESSEDSPNSHPSEGGAQPSC